MHIAKENWKVDENDNFKVVSADPYGGMIATTSNWWVDTESAFAIAKLIASAPDLLEACENALIDPDNDHAIEMIEQAVDKARGL